MKEPDWERIQEIYHEALNLPRSERSNFVVEASNNDPVLVREVSELLDAGDLTPGFLQTPILELPLRPQMISWQQLSTNAISSRKNLAAAV
jgi:hypothetical protein